RNALPRQAEADGVCVAAETSEQVSAALESFEQMETPDGTAGAVSLARFIARDHQRRTVVTLDHTRGGDANHAAMPSVASNDQGVAITRILHLFGDRSQNI